MLVTFFDAKWLIMDAGDKNESYTKIRVVHGLSR